MDNVEPVCMPYKLLSEITDGFSDKRIVGRGTYGVVYKGEDKDAQVFAVKILKIFEGVKNDDFHREFNNLAKLRHENIVQLLGFCNETENEVVEHNGKQVCAERIHRALCFKYMPNGSLHEHLYDAYLGFGWSKRYRIIKGICEGLKYLHMGSRPMYHLDLKPRNILLDDNMVPKIADFGLSRLVLGEENTSKETISVVGTCGYVPPEYINHQIISKEFDIFSLGVIIIKIMMGSAGYFLISDMEPDKFIEHVCNKWKERLQVSGRPYTLIILQVNKCIKIALKCIEMHRKSRPTIEFIVHQLSETEKHTNYSLSLMEEFDDRKSIPPKSNDLGRRYQEISHEASIHISMEKKLQLITEFPREPKLHFVEDITGNFANEREIGKGSFGVVYKGVLQNGEVVAVKRLLGFPEINLDKQFANEVLSLIDLNHRNIVNLIGYCYETKRKLVESHGRYVFADTAERILCYEYLPTGSLDKYLYGASHELNWNISFKIIQGICQGLQFLHELQRPIIHMDLNLSNILLDDNLMPKIADFGLSRLFGEEQTRTLTSNVVGTRGYMAPEYYYRGEVSTRSDIYSLGILIIEIVTGIKVDSNTEDLSSKNLIDSVQKTWTKMPQIASKYPTLEASSLQQVKRCIDVGLNCVSENPKERPSIGKIMEELNGSGFSSSS